MNISSISAFLISVISSYLLTIPLIYYAKKIHLVTDKKKRYHPAHTHTGLIPRGGGIPIFLAIFITSLFLLPLTKIVLGILISGFLLGVTGIMDDYFDLSPYFRFLLNLLISALVISFGLGIPYISNPFGGVLDLNRWQFSFNLFGRHSVLFIADIIAIFWLTWLMNMVNWSKGIDGQLPGFVAITAFFLGILSRLSFGKVGTAILILSIPMMDAVYTISRRLKNKQSPFKADWGHFHHKLLELGWGKRRIAVFYWLVSIILGISALFLKGIEKLTAFVTLAIVLLVFILLIENVKRV